MQFDVNLTRRNNNNKIKKINREKNDINFTFKPFIIGEYTSIPHYLEKQYLIDLDNDNLMPTRKKNRDESIELSLTY